MAGGPLYNGLVDNPGKHEHRFPYFREGDTHLTCEDCRQVVFITPEESAKISGKPYMEDVVLPVEHSLPTLLMHLSGRVPQYVRVALRYDAWVKGGIV